MLPEPIHRGAQAVLERGVGVKADLLLGPRRVKHPTWLTVRLARVPLNPAREVGDLCDQLHQVADRDLLAHTNVDGLWAVIAFGRHHDRLGTVLDVEKLA